MVTKTLLLVFHPLIRTAREIAAIELILLKQELRRMDKYRVHLIIYIRRHEDMIQTIPFTLITIGSLHAILGRCILGDVLQVVTGNVLYGRRVMVVVEVTTDQDLCIRSDGP